MEKTDTTVVEVTSPDDETKATESTDDGVKTVVTLHVPDRVEMAATSQSRTSSVSSTRSNRSMTMRLPAKWFFQREGRTNTNSTTRSRATSGTSRGSYQPSETESARAHRIQRKKSVMHGIMKRGRTMRKTVKAMQINEADPGGSEREGRGGYALTSEQKLRMYVLKEILETEEDYTKLLQFIVDVIIPNLQRLAKDDKITCVTADTVPQMLSNIRDIHRLHVRFSAALSDVMEPYPYHTNCIGNIFLDHRDEFKIYGEFCANFKNAQRISYQLQEDPTVLALIQEWKDSVASKSRKFLHLEGFIISPVQRLCKYPLLLRELKKFTPESHNDNDAVTKAMTMMEDVTASVNETERRAITMQAIRDVDNLFDNWEKSGLLSKQGFMTKQGGSVKTWNIRWFTLSGYEMKYYHEPTDTRPLGVLDLTSYKALEEEPSAQLGRPFAFGIKMPDRTYYMYTISEKEKREWITILNWKISCIDRSRKQAHRPLETMIFSSLSSFLHPKERVEPPTQKNDSIIMALPSNQNKDEDQHQKPISKSRSKSLFKSFRSRRKQRASQSISSHSHSQDG